ncbi:MAG: cellulase family glycosylhydrolase [Phyllobacteriaceae bacterium]|nr:cellulase family glycosylhydrolase [Phyllobacteriaceae bacterium]
MSLAAVSRRRLGLGAALLLAFVLAVSAPLAGASAEVPTLRRGVNLELWQQWTGRDAFLAPGYDRSNFPDWSKRVDDDRLAALRRQGFDFVRLNVDPSPFFWDETLDDRLLDSVEASVRRLLGVGFAVVIDLHAVPDAPDRPQGLHWILGTGDAKASFGFIPYVGLVRRFAARFAGLPANRVALELLNEPDQDWFSRFALTDRWPGQLASLVAAARAVAPRLPLVLSGGRGGGSEGLLRLDPSPYAHDDAILWTFHTYEPLAITHSGLPWEKTPAHFLTGLPYPAARLDDATAARLKALALARVAAEIADPGERAKLAEAIDGALDKYRRSQAGPATLAAEMRAVADWAGRHGIARDHVLLGEFGGYQDATSLEILAAIVRATREAAEAEGFAWAIYTAGLTRAHSSFGILADTTTMTVEEPIAAALGLR